MDKKFQRRRDGKEEYEKDEAACYEAKEKEVDTKIG